jgi:hypothetical protein
MPDNRQIKDGIGNLFNVRMRDLSAGGDGSIMRSMILSTPYPVDYGTGGIYQHCAKSGILAAGMAANSPIYSFQWPSSSLLALIKKIRLNAATDSVAFAAGAGLATFDLFAARGFTVADSGGIHANLVGDFNQLRTSMNASAASVQIASSVPLTPGTRVLDTDPMESKSDTAPSTAFSLFNLNQPVTLFEKSEGDHPLFLVQNEGFVIRATVPATGTWRCWVTTEWNEVVIY